jgi:hypothetical protein
MNATHDHRVMKHIFFALSCLVLFACGGPLEAPSDKDDDAFKSDATLEAASDAHEPRAKFIRAVCNVATMHCECSEECECDAISNKGETVESSCQGVCSDACVNRGNP